MKKVKGFIIIVLVVCMLLCSCGSIQEESSIVIEEKDRDTVLKVYMYGSGVHTNYGEEYYQTRYSIGECREHAYVWGEEGHMYNAGINEFDRICPLEVEVTYFDGTGDMLAQVAQEVENGNGPDVIVGSYTTGAYDLYPSMYQGVFEDLKPFFEKDSIYAEGNYINSLLEAGDVDGKQYIFPLTFNMNILMTSKEVMQKKNLWLSKEYTVDEIQQVFEARWRELAQKQNETEIPLMQFTRMRLNFEVDLFRNGGGVSFVDPETKQVRLEREYFEQLLSSYEAYLYQNFRMKREELTLLANETQGHLASKDTIDGEAEMVDNRSVLNFFDILHDRIICFADGGSYGYSSHSFAAQANYYESRYRDAEEEFVCIGIPTRQNPKGYAAQITSFGGVVKNARHPEEGYQLLKMLADTKRFAHFDLSVNRQRMEDTLQELTTMEYDFYPAMGNFPPDRVPEGQDWKGDCYTIQPMSQETVEYLKEMIDKIEVATLPNQTVNEIVYSAMEDYIYRGVETVDEAYQNAVKQLEEYVENNY